MNLFFVGGGSFGAIGAGPGSAIGWGRIAAGQPFPWIGYTVFCRKHPVTDHLTAGRSGRIFGMGFQQAIRGPGGDRPGPGNRFGRDVAVMGMEAAGSVCVKDGFFASGMRGDPILEGRDDALPAFHAGGCLCRRKDFVAAEDRGLCRVDLLRHQLERGSALTKPQKEGAGYLAVSDPSG